MTDYKEKARKLLAGWKGSDYIFGTDCIDRTGALVSPFGKKVLLIGNTTHMKAAVDSVAASLADAGLEIITGGPVPGARPNSPTDDVYRLAAYILQYKPDCVVPVGGGSTIDACKAAVVLASMGGAVPPEITAYFGTGIVSSALERTGRSLIPLIAVQTSSSSGSHLTKYANITDMIAGQKKLIVDNAIVPVRQMFDYSVTASMSASVTTDGVMDALSHTVEVFLGAKPGNYELAGELCRLTIGLIAQYAARAIRDPDDIDAREALGLATDLGGYAIMVGGTSGGHLTSFSLVDCVAHGTACGLMNPYYAVFYSKAIQRQLKDLAGFFNEAGVGFTDTSLAGRPLAIAVANTMQDFSKSIGAPVRLTDIPGFRADVHVPRALSAAKDPDLGMKLGNMPVPMTAQDVDTCMAGILEAACTGDFSLIKDLS